MKEKLIQEISNAMTEILSVEQIAQLNGLQNHAKESHQLYH